MVFKCKMCGGDIVPIEGTNTGKCEYCKSVMTLPSSDDEKIINLYNRANDYRLSNDFDKAYSIFETILELDNSQIEAHWGLLLCKYGVEYVDDPIAGKKIPTCHRTITTSILKDSEFEIIKKTAYGRALELYEKEAGNIATIQKKILEMSSKEEPYDVFICYKESDENGERTNDSVIAQDIYDKLVEKGYKVFFSRITLEDKLGSEYEPCIYSALMTSKIMLVVGTKEEYFNSVWVKNEWSRYLEMMKNDKSKSLIPVFSKIDAYKLPEEFLMYQAQSMDKVGALQDLIRGIDKLLNSQKVLTPQTDAKSPDFTYEMYERFKKIKEEEEKAERDSLMWNKEVDMLTVVSTRNYKIITFILSLLQAIIIFLIIGNKNMMFIKDLHNSIPFDNLYLFSSYGRSYAGFIILCTCCITLISYILSLVNKQCVLVSKFLYLLNLMLIFSLYLKFGMFGYYISPLFTAFAVTNIALVIINPKWKLTKRVLFVTSERKEEILEKNKDVKVNFREYTSFPTYLYIPLIVTIIVFTGGLVYNFIAGTNSLSCKRDNSVKQLQVKNSYLNIRKSAVSSSTLITRAYEGDVLTIIDSNDIKPGTWYKISTATGLTGYVYSGDKYEYVTILE